MNSVVRPAHFLHFMGRACTLAARHGHCRIPARPAHSLTRSPSSALLSPLLGEGSPTKVTETTNRVPTSSDLSRTSQKSPTPTGFTELTLPTPLPRPCCPTAGPPRAASRKSGGRQLSASPRAARRPSFILCIFALDPNDAQMNIINITNHPRCGVERRPRS